VSDFPKISIISPSYNQERFIEDTLRSVSEQQYPHLEHIIVDGASTDSSTQILERLCSTAGWEYLRWKSEPDHGQSEALNKGFRLASGDIVGWLNSDDIFRLGTLRKVAQVFADHRDIDFVYGDYDIIDESGGLLLHKKEIEFDWSIMLCGLNYIAQPNVFFRRRVFDAIGYLDESLHYVMDYEFWLRAANHRMRFLHVPQAFAACRWHLDAKTVSRNPAIESEINFVRRKYWNKLQFGHLSIQSGYERFCSVHARASRQWRKLRTRHAIDLLPASLYLKSWKRREGKRRAAVAQ
jgi:glycosyltransferase involved in cell wall biosynthesis